MARHPDQRQLREIMRNFALVTQVGLTMVSCILVAMVFGLWLADLPGAIVGMIIGVAAGFYSCYRMLMKPGSLLRHSEKNPKSPDSDSKET